MNLTVTTEHEMIRQAARDFAQNDTVLIAAEIDGSDEFLIETIEKIGALGLTGNEVPYECGGAWIDLITAAMSGLPKSTTALARFSAG